MLKLVHDLFWQKLVNCYQFILQFLLKVSRLCQTFQLSFLHKRSPFFLLLFFAKSIATHKYHVFTNILGYVFSMIDIELLPLTSWLGMFCILHIKSNNMHRTYPNVFLCCWGTILDNSTCLHMYLTMKIAIARKLLTHFKTE